IGAGAGAAVAVAVTLGLLVGIWLLVRRGTGEERRGARALAVVVGGGLVLGLLLAIGGWDYLVDRNLIWLIVPVVVISAAGLGLTAAGRLGPAIAVAICCVSAGAAVSAAGEIKNGEDWAGAVAAMGDARGARMVVTRDGSGFRGIRAYTDAVPLTAAEMPLVDELVLIDAPGTGSDPAWPPAPPAPGLSPAEEIQAEHFSLVRYRSEQPVSLSRPQVAGGLGADPRYVLIER
ncbi:MAG TPA: hypothetical protein VKA36_06505, partial [Solirubrobacterales bacterium]|nr:hypothetical protein [Solirubrobacterales bacterium]